MHRQRRRPTHSRPSTPPGYSSSPGDSAAVSLTSPAARSPQLHNTSSSSVSISKHPLHRRHRPSRSMNAIQFPQPISTQQAATAEYSATAGFGSLAVKLMPFQFMRRSKGAERHRQDAVLLSTPEERFSSRTQQQSRFAQNIRFSFSAPPPSATPPHPPTTRRFKAPDLHAQPPTVAQIAMGLHTSRTPHLRPHSRQNSEPPSEASISPSPSIRTSQKKAGAEIHKPLRSSLKKPSVSLSASTSASTSTGPITPSPQSTLSRQSIAVDGGAHTVVGNKFKNKLRLDKLLGRGHTPSIKVSSSDPSLTLVPSSEDEAPRKSVRFVTFHSEEQLEGIMSNLPTSREKDAVLLPIGEADDHSRL